MGENQSFFGHGSGVAGHVKFFVQDFDSCGNLGGFLIELVEVGDLPSQPPVIKVFDIMLQVHKVAAGPDKEGVEPGRERFDRVLFAMAHHVSLCIQINNVRGLIEALFLMVASHSAIVQSLDRFGRAKDSITEGDVEVGNLSFVLDVAIRRPVKVVFIVLTRLWSPRICSLR
jgi:hypothetical protein